MAATNAYSSYEFLRPLKPPMAVTNAYDRNQSRTSDAGVKHVQFGALSS